MIFLMNRTEYAESAVSGCSSGPCDGRGFDTEQNRPTNLQIPLIRK
jgi:hypothetical protein